MIVEGVAKYSYKGELDSDGNACGHGTAVNVRHPDWKYEGTFFKDYKHGLGEFTITTLIAIFVGILEWGGFTGEKEWRYGLAHGKETTYEDM